MGGPIRTFRDLRAWQLGMDLCVAARDFCRSLPEEERFILVPQIRRAAHSIPLNIAEGYGTGTTPGFLKHLRIARGSLAEVDSACEVGCRLYDRATATNLNPIIRETDAVLQGLIRSLESKVSSSKVPSEE